MRQSSHLPSLLVTLLTTAWTTAQDAQPLLQTEKLAGEGVWIMPALQPTKRVRPNTRVTVWFDEQLLGDGQAYQRRATQLAGRKRRELRRSAIATLKALSQRSHTRAAPGLQQLIDDGSILDLERHWLINGFSCTINGKAALDALGRLPGVRKIFRGRSARRRRTRPDNPKFVTADPAGPAGVASKASTRLQPFDQDRYRHPWYTHALLADRVWREFGITGAGTLNIIHDGNFVLEGNAAASIYRNPDEIPGNGKDDDGNGLVDDYHGYNFVARSPQLQRSAAANSAQLHGTMCASIICGTGTKEVPIELGLAPRGKWAGVIAGPRIEAAIEWAIERGADTYSMSFSIPGLGEYRSHWRKVMEHGSLCGVYFVSGAGNFARKGNRSYAPVPVQMRTPEDIPAVVFAAAGVQRDLSRTSFSSQGPVDWQLEHYHEGRVQKPEVCAFNSSLPTVYPDGRVFDAQISGNSFAGPMFCGSIALMLAADPDLLPWDLLEIITSTALDVGPAGLDDQTGHGLINCYRAVKEVLRRRAQRDGQDTAKYTGRVEGDALDPEEYQRRLADRRPQVLRVRPNSPAAHAGIRPGDVPVEVDGKAVANRAEFDTRLRAALASRRAGRVGRAGVPITFRRGKQEIEIEFKITRANTGILVRDVFTEPAYR